MRQETVGLKKTLVENIPANMTIPKHHSVFLRTQPRSSIFSLSRGYLLSFQSKVPVNLSSLLFGGSQMTSPEDRQMDTATFSKQARTDLKEGNLIKSHLTVEFNQF